MESTQTNIKSPSRTHIRKYSPEDITEVCRLVKDVWDEAASIRVGKRYSWQFYENPYTPDDGPAILVMESNGTINAMVCGLGCLLKVGERYVKSQWIVDFMVHPGYRGKRGIVLTNKIKKMSRITLGFPVENSLSIWYRAGGEKLGTSIGYSRILNFETMFKKKKWPAVVFKLGSFLTGCFNAWIDRTSRGASSAYDIVEIKTFDERFDDLWARESRHYNFIQARNAAFLNWRFVRIPHLAYRIFAAQKDGRILGYVVVRTGEYKKVRSGFLVDIFAEKGNKDVYYALLQRGVETLKNDNVAVISGVFVTRDQTLLNALRTVGMIFTQEYQTGLCYGRDEDFNFKDQHNRFFSLADSDLEFS